MATVRFLAGSRDFSVLYSFQTGFGANPAFCPMGTGGGGLFLSLLVKPLHVYIA
jgi:hypothetical protein